MFVGWKPPGPPSLANALIQLLATAQPGRARLPLGPIIDFVTITARLKVGPFPV